MLVRFDFQGGVERVQRLSFLLLFSLRGGKEDSFMRIFLKVVARDFELLDWAAVDVDEFFLIVLDLGI